ncbi:translation initiation factor IF-3 [bacterium B17]|nr:translation initiation factor IF-3 [bacterium B17]
MLGVMPTAEARKLAQEAGLDLVEISPNADPPVCRIMDFGKFRYDESIRQKKSRKQSRAHSRPMKEIKFHANVAEHDYHTKVNHIKKFLEKGHKVKVSLQFRGRENAHKELGFEVINKVLQDCEGLCVVDMKPKLVGRNIAAVLGTKSSK